MLMMIRSMMLIMIFSPFDHDQINYVDHEQGNYEVYDQSDHYCFNRLNLFNKPHNIYVHDSMDP